MTTRSALVALLAATTLAGAAQAAPVFTTQTRFVYDHSQDAAPFATSSEIVAYDPASQLIFVSGGDGVTALDGAGNRVRGYGELGDLGDGQPFRAIEPTSVAVQNGIVAISAAITSGDGMGNDSLFGGVQFYDIAGNFLREARTTIVTGNPADDANLPDTVAFTPDGLRVVVANEGESGPGSVAVVTVATGAVGQATFGAFDNPASRAALAAQGAVLNGAASLDDQLQPEYVAIASDGLTAFVTIQEQNIIATVDISGAVPVVTGLRGLGFIDRSVDGQGFDPTDRDNGPLVRTFDGALSTREPDQIATFTQGGERYTVTADEGDGGNVLGDFLVPTVANLDPTVFPDPAVTLAPENLGRGDRAGIDTDGDGDIDQILFNGGRSVTIRDAAGNITWTSGDAIEQALILAGLLNDGRSDNRGPEPEGLVIGELGGHRLLFVTIERGASVLVFDITDPTSGEFVQIITSTDPNNPFDEPEGIDFIPSALSFDGFDYLVISSEGSDQTFLQRITLVPAPASLVLFGLGAGLLALRRTRR